VSDEPNASQTDAFVFIQNLAAELSSGKVDLPSFPEVAIRVRKVLADDSTTTRSWCGLWVRSRRSRRGCSRWRTPPL